MLTVAKITSGNAAGYAQYLEGKSQASELGDYYLKDGERVEAPGRWAAGAERFGLDASARVTGEQLRALMAVRRPDDGGELRRLGGSGEAVAAIDATFSAPKSVSAAWAISGPEIRSQIEAAHEHAVDLALGYATGQVAMLRRRVSSTKVIHEKATGLVASSWRHTTARAVGEQVPDPQLHSHVLLHAAVRRDGRLVAIDSRSLLVHQREIGAAYRTELARELQALGFQVNRGTGRGGRYFELEVIPQSLIDRWSSRHHQVQAAIRERLEGYEQRLEELVLAAGDGASEAAEQLELLHKFGQLAPREERLAALVARGGKTPVTATDLDREWQHTAIEHHISRERLEILRQTANTTPLEPATPQQVLEALTEFDSTFAAREARAAALEQSAGCPILVALDQLRALRATGEILLLADGTGTTRDHRGYERAVVAITRRLAVATATAIPENVTTRETARLDQELAGTGGCLSVEQREAILLGCGERRMVVIEGHAGTGKSTTLTGIARAHQEAGRRIVVTSTAALAAERLTSDLQNHGVDCAAYSTAGLHAAISHGRLELGPETTVIHDEAALASTREQLRLLRAVESSGARLVAVGDPRQNQPVGAGGLWDTVEHTARDAGGLVELTINQRARDKGDRHSQTLFRKGEFEFAIRSYSARDRVHTDSDQRQTEDQALEAAQRDREQSLNVLVVAQTSNEHLDELNARAQAIRKQRGQLAGQQVPVPGRPYGLHEGDEVQVRHTITHPDHGPLRNGTGAIITAVDTEQGEIELRLADGTRLRLDLDQVEHADLRLSYVQHPFPAQGHTTDMAHVIITSQATREGTYVAITRAREQTHLYTQLPAGDAQSTDRVLVLADLVSRSEPEVPSIRIPLAHEHTITQHAELETATAHEPETRVIRAITAEPDLEADRQPGQQAGPRATAAREQTGRDEPTQPPARRWPGRDSTPGNELAREQQQLTPERDIGWEI